MNTAMHVLNRVPFVVVLGEHFLWLKKIALFAISTLHKLHKQSFINTVIAYLYPNMVNFDEVDLVGVALKKW